MMSIEDIDRHNLVVRPASAVTTANRNTGSVLARMTGNALAIARNKSALIAMRHRIGDYEFCDPDYRQIVLWADALGITPDEVVSRLDRSKINLADFGMDVRDGSIVRLVWDFELLPIERFDWVPGLQIRELAFVGRFPGNNRHMCLSLDKLEWLQCNDISLASIDLSGAPSLRGLECCSNDLRQIDLTHSKCMRNLYCGHNANLRLELPYMPSLEGLFCVGTNSKQLNLMMTPNLESLDCAGNGLTDLDLSGVSKLISLDCSDNELRELDLSPTPNLSRLRVPCNQLTSLDLSPLHELSWLTCWGNRIGSLDLSHLKKLEKLSCSFNPLTVIDLSLHPHPEKIKTVGHSAHMKVIMPSGSQQ